ncbi:ATP synthase F0 sector subunit b' [invertebrate metagenome]|uniref:ATP synthase F0 sector subunit b n=1 Tax=invertebrate metagenome TaxID=1711999 RepID=A0A484HBM5_9ZZZZ
MLPQFNTTFFPSQLFWLVICFGTLYLLMARLALPRITDVLSERQRRIDDDLDRAAQIQAQTEATIRDYEQALADARSQAFVVLQQSQEEVARLVQNHSWEVTKRLAAEVKAGEESIAAAKQVVLGQVKEIAAEVAEGAVSRLIGLTLEADHCQEAVAAVLKERS